MRRLPPAVLVLLPLLALAPAPAVARDAVLDDVEAYLRGVYPADAPGATVAAVRDGEVVFCGAFGLADVELGVPMRPDMVFRIGSVTKSFTAAAVLLLVEDGTLALDTPVHEVVADWPAEPPVTVEQLLTHTSGIPNYTLLPAWMERMREDVTPSELVGFFRHAERSFAPGRGWSYSNSNYALLGRVIESVSGASYGTFLKRRIFEPLGMARTRLDDAQAIVPGRVRGYEQGGDGLRAAGFVSMTHSYAAGGLLSTADDLARWHQAVQARRLLPPATWARALEPQVRARGVRVPYGHGWFPGSLRGRPMAQHWGRISGFRAASVLLKDDRVSVVVLSNHGGHDPAPSEVAYHVAALLVGEQVPTEPEVDLPAPEMAPYVGTYRVPGGRDLTVRLEAGRLRLDGAAAEPVELLAAGEDRFAVRGRFEEVRFLRDDERRVTRIEWRPLIVFERRLGLRAGTAARSGGWTPSPEDLRRYAGDYKLMPAGLVVQLRVRGGVLTASAPGQPRVNARAGANEHEFLILRLGALVRFRLGADGRATGFDLNAGRTRMTATRVADAPAQAAGATAAPNEEPSMDADPETRLATFGGGCFWCTEAIYERLKGVRSVTSGYSGGTVEDPTYEAVCAGVTGHAEVVQVAYDPRQVTYAELLEVFFKTHDPTTLNRQGADVGTQYRSIILHHDDAQREVAERVKRELDAAGIYDDAIVTEIVPFERFYAAEAYHQDYYASNPRQGYCRAVIQPKLAKFEKLFRDMLREGR